MSSHLWSEMSVIVIISRRFHIGFLCWKEAWLIDPVMLYKREGRSMYDTYCKSIEHLLPASGGSVLELDWGVVVFSATFRAWEGKLGLAFRLIWRSGYSSLPPLFRARAREDLDDHPVQKQFSLLLVSNLIRNEQAKAGNQRKLHIHSGCQKKTNISLFTLTRSE
jgi:hypothetical protein